VNGLGSLLLGADAAPVVGGGGVDVGVAGQCLNGDQVAATVEQVGNVGAAQVVGLKPLGGEDACQLGALLDGLLDYLS
jgi:hypothetical protein